MKSLICVILMLIILVNSQETLIQTVEQCTACNTAGSIICTQNLNSATPVCCSALDTFDECNPDKSFCNVSDGAKTNFPESIKYVMCPSPDECKFTDYTISKLNEDLTLTFDLVPEDLYCRVRVFIDPVTQNSIDFTNYESTNVNAAILFTVKDSDVDVPSDKLNFQTNLTPLSIDNRTMSIEEQQDVYIILSLTGEESGRFRITTTLRRTSRNGLSYTETWMLIVLCVWGGIVLLWLLMF
jgi:hypothetical protein